MRVWYEACLLNDTSLTSPPSSGMIKWPVCYRVIMILEDHEKAPYRGSYSLSLCLFGKSTYSMILTLAKDYEALYGGVV